jgi:hypothetical protein
MSKHSRDDSRASPTLTWGSAPHYSLAPARSDAGYDGSIGRFGHYKAHTDGDTKRQQHFEATARPVVQHCGDVYLVRWDF